MDVFVFKKTMIVYCLLRKNIYSGPSVSQKGMLKCHGDICISKTMTISCLLRKNISRERTFLEIRLSLKEDS